MKRSAWVLLLAVVVGGCQADEGDRRQGATTEVAGRVSGPAAPSEPAEVAEPKAAPAEPVPAPPSLVLPQVFKGSPLDEEEQTFELVWKGAAGELEVRGSAEDGAEVTGRRKVKKGQRLKWTSSVVRVEEPQGVKAKAATTLQGAMRFDDEGSKPRALPIAAGDTVDIFKYGGEGMCVVGVSGVLYDAVCPQPEEFEAEGWDGRSSARRQQWWVELEGAPSGWVKVDGTQLRGRAVSHGGGD